MPKKKTPEEMSEDELTVIIDDLGHQRKELRDEAHALAEVRNRKRLKARAEAKVARMSDEERQALAQAVQVDGIAPEEATGEISGDQR